ncbi:alanyl-tRNA synthetase-like protein [Rhexocercosporidium sp. MPI-PUGE-AT-0058]|nr:alanyl-tRNA synthetase-like protein [Rhexocercosporidium sp. MPI-PUGE-AT-0058]
MTDERPPVIWGAVKVRNTYFSHFEKNGHTLVESSPVVPHDDPTLLFTNAGMNQFKPIFQGTISREDDMAKLTRAVDTQKCIRAGGKHNDLDDVGKDGYHHAIQMAWDLLTKVFGLDKERLYVTYFEGDKAAGLEPDYEARDLWLAVGVAEDHMGDQGPCVPCSEVHYDRIGGGRNAAHLVNMDDPNVLEIWNIVFIQFNREADGSLRTLPNKHIDTGMGFERLVSVLQNKKSNYDTDIFHPLFAQIQQITGARAYTDKYYDEDVDKIDEAYRVIADHIRTLTHSIADGAVPHSDGRGYVIRRVLRRGCRYARRYFNAEIGSFFSKILPTLVAQMGEQFPNIVAKQNEVKELLDEEEEAFSRTLDRGKKMFEKYAAETLQNSSKKLSGESVWRLYDTFGFPVDLTQIMATERGLESGDWRSIFLSKADKNAVYTFAKLDVHHISELQSMNIPGTDDSAKFLKGGSTGKVLIIFDGQKFHRSTKELPSEQPVAVILDKTNFYAEQGGQVNDTGKLVIDGVTEFKVFDTQSYGDYIVHNGTLQYGELNAGEMNNHTGTHILNHALRKHLGDGVQQKGSLVDEDKWRFDFSHKSAVTPAELEKIEGSSNEYIKQNCQVYTKEVERSDALKINGLRAVFGETYPNPVRVVSVGVPVDDLLKDPENSAWMETSIEFCGGTHVEKTGIIKELIIVEESGIAKGIRRVVCFTGQAAYQAQLLADQARAKIDDLDKMAHGTEKETADILDEQKRAQKAESKTAVDFVVKYFDDNKNEDYFIGQLPISGNPKAVAEVLNYIKAKDKSKTVYLFGGDENSVVFGTYVGTEHAKKGIKAEEWASTVFNVIGGRSGGKEPTRTGQGTNPDKIDEGVAVATEWFSKINV